MPHSHIYTIYVCKFELTNDTKPNLMRFSVYVWNTNLNQSFRTLIQRVCNFREKSINWNYHLKQQSESQLKVTLKFKQTSWKKNSMFLQVCFVRWLTRKSNKITYWKVHCNHTFYDSRTSSHTCLITRLESENK